MNLSLLLVDPEATRLRMGEALAAGLSRSNPVCVWVKRLPLVYPEATPFVYG